MGPNAPTTAYDDSRSPPAIKSGEGSPVLARGQPDEARPAPASPPISEFRPAPRELAPRAAPPGARLPRDTYRASEADTLDLAAQARRTLAESVPYAAARAQVEVARVLRVAAYAGHPAQEGNIVDAVARAWPSYQIVTSVPSILPASARQLSEQARHAYVVQRNVGHAFDLQLRAFGANPHDAEVAANLAFLFLRANPGQPETARQLVLHAIALRASKRQAAIVDDWSTLAVASALMGRVADASHALFVMVALARELDRNCRVVLGAVERYGDPMVAPAQAMMTRIRQHGRDRESPYCAGSVNSRTAGVY
jgi:hypothetical protein